MTKTLRLTMVCAFLGTLPIACVDPNAPDLAAPESGENIDQVEESSAAVSISQTLIDAFGVSLRDDLLTPYYPTAHDGSYGGFIEDRGNTWGL